MTDEELEKRFSALEKNFVMLYNKIYAHMNENIKTCGSCAHAKDTTEKIVMCEESAIPELKFAKQDACPFWEVKGE